MSDRPDALIRSLRLSPHPEGGHYREIFRSPHTVARPDGVERSAITCIFFLLAAREVSRSHEVAADEIWHFVEGHPLEMFLIDPDLRAPRRSTLGTLGDGNEPVLVVPAGQWQAARPTGPYTLTACIVGPGFDFADFRMMRSDLPLARRFTAVHPDLADLL